MKTEAVSEIFYPAKRAIVIGGGVGGLSVARVLSDYFGQVLVLERDKLPGERLREAFRKGKHPLICCRRAKALENLFRFWR